MTQTRPARLEELLDRQDILDCLTRFSRGPSRSREDPSYQRPLTNKREWGMR